MFWAPEEKKGQVRSLRTKEVDGWSETIRVLCGSDHAFFDFKKTKGHVCFEELCFDGQKEKEIKRSKDM
jgi:hypothetical protein